MIHLSTVPPLLVGSVWPKAAPYLSQALMSGGADYYDMGDIRRFIEQGRMTLWVLIADDEGVHGAGVTEIVEYPKKRIASVVLFAADPDLRETWLPKLESVERWAWEMGCSAVKVPGRMGWKTLLRDYRMAHVVLTKELSDDAESMVRTA